MLVETINLWSMTFPGQGDRCKSTKPDRPRPAPPPGHRRPKKRHLREYVKDSDPWIEGYEARQMRLSRSANPYSSIDSHRLWDDGWMEAQSQGAP
jgi:hypothetical protein